MANHLLLLSYQSLFFQGIDCKLSINTALQEVKKELKKLELTNERPKIIFSSREIKSEEELIKNWVSTCMEIEDFKFEPVILDSNENSILFSNTIVSQARDEKFTILVHNLDMNDLVKSLFGHEKRTNNNDMVLTSLSEDRILLVCPYAWV